MTGREGLFELRRTRNHTVVLLVSAVDRRIVPAVRFVSALACTDSRALHVVVDPVVAHRIAEDWMRLGLTWLPLSMRDAAPGALLPAIRDAVGQEVEGTGRVTVVVPELQLPGRRHLRRPATAAGIARCLQPLAGVTTVIVPFCPPMSSGRAARRVGWMRSHEEDRR